MAQGSVITVGTNGKTSTSNLLADAFRSCRVHYHLQSHRGESGCGHHLGASAAAGCPVGRFRMRRAVARSRAARLRSNYVLLLNLFRDQLDRCGEIDRIQTSIAGALAASPDTVLVYNADDRCAPALPTRCPTARSPMA